MKFCLYIPVGNVTPGEFQSQTAIKEMAHALEQANDEALKDEWKGFRSSRLNQQHRVIYQTERDNILVKVIEVTPHDYRRK